MVLGELPNAFLVSAIFSTFSLVAGKPTTAKRSFLPSIKLERATVSAKSLVVSTVTASFSLP